MKNTIKRPKEDKGQSSIFDFGDFSEEEKKHVDEQLKLSLEYQVQRVSHENHIKDSKTFDDYKDSNEDDDLNLRSEQIRISKDSYPSISDSDNKNRFLDSINNMSKCNHFSKNLYNQCLFEIRQAFFEKINDAKDEIEKILRIKIRSALNKFKNNSFNYKNTIYKLLDKYFKEQSKNRNIEDKERDNYSWSPQAAQQTIDLAVEAWYDNDLARADYPKHPQDYTGKPGICKYRKNSEYITIFTNQQCHIETKSILVLESMSEDRLRYVTKNFLTFPDHLNIKPIETRFDDKTDLREVRIIPQTLIRNYKIELVYKKVIDKIKIKLFNLDPNRIIGIDTGQENVVTIANNCRLRPIVVKGGILLSINQWFDKIGSKLYSIYSRQQSCYGQQGFKGKDSKGKKIIIGEKMKNLSSHRINIVLDILHKISRFIINHCIDNRIGTIVWGRNPGWKQNINLGKKTNQKFTKIPHYLLFKILKYKASEVGIKVIDIEESHTSKCSFLDDEPIGHKEKGQYVGKRIKRGIFRSLKGILINADVNAAYNMIKKVFPEAFKSIGIAGVVLHPERLSIKDLLSRPNS